MSLTYIRLFISIVILIHEIDARHRSYYGTKAPYKVPVSSSHVPKEFELVCSQMIVRHGCRTLKTVDFDRLTMMLWNQAKNENALTDYGRQFGEDIQDFMTITDRIGREQLSKLGKREQKNLAHRLSKRFEHILRNSSRKIRLVSSGLPRTQTSLHAFATGMPLDAASLFIYENPNPNLLLFNPSSTKRHQRFHSTLESIRIQPLSKRMAYKFLRRLYKPSFIRRLAHGHYNIVDHDLKQSIENEIDAASAHHAVLLNTASLREDGVRPLLEKYFSPDEQQWFTYLYDAKKYYQSGPSFYNQTISFDNAQVLLDDFVLHAEECSRTTAKHFLRARFGHAETIIPFAALLQIPILSDKQTFINDTFTYENNAWRGEILSPLSANIQWEIYRYENILVRMLLNEYPVPFKRQCRPYSERHHLFYSFDELKRCYRRQKS
ncbi:unnamed protein product [Adineta ricciae]|uniref:Multiple inositol polyphosphate phosphatase 1 n=1 Tax=Adineta ricciae TaxID=249248 RepID=A0A814RXI1_ADIRI|nr:unnamed protein product [Adineta ricciae]CAF1400106.1 unnamed protein product [Adineta ricciae]